MSAIIPGCASDPVVQSVVLDSIWLHVSGDFDRAGQERLYCHFSTVADRVCIFEGEPGIHFQMILDKHSVAGEAGAKVVNGAHAPHTRVRLA
jgi:hypothetical protein